MIERYVLLFVGVVSANDAFTQEFQHQNSFSYRLTGVSFVDTSVGWVIGDQGSARTTDGGSTWITGPKGAFESISVCENSIIWATWTSSSYGYVGRSTNEGVTWLTLDSIYDGGISQYHYRKVRSRDTLRAWLLEGSSGLADFVNAWKTKDGGRSWVTSAPSRFYSYYTDVALGADSAVALLFAGRQVLRSSDDGSSWRTDTLSGNYNALAYQGARQVWIVGDSGRILHASEISMALSRQHSGSMIKLNAAAAIDSLTVWVVGDSGAIFKTLDGGTTWVLLTAGTSANLYALSFVDSYHGWIVGDSGTIIRVAQGVPSGIKESPSTEQPFRFSLLQNYPNPFNPTTTIRYSLPQRTHVMLTVFNILGQDVATLVDAAEEPGEHSVRFEGKRLATGVYIYRLKTGESVETRCMMLTK